MGGRDQREIASERNEDAEFAFNLLDDGLVGQQLFAGEPP